MPHQPLRWRAGAGLGSPATRPPRHPAIPFHPCLSQGHRTFPELHIPPVRRIRRQQELPRPLGCLAPGMPHRQPPNRHPPGFGKVQRFGVPRLTGGQRQTQTPEDPPRPCTSAVPAVRVTTPRWKRVNQRKSSVRVATGVADGPTGKTIAAASGWPRAVPIHRPERRSPHPANATDAAVAGRAP